MAAVFFRNLFDIKMPRGRVADDIAGTSFLLKMQLDRVSSGSRDEDSDK
jgi:hypothetical protein